MKLSKKLGLGVAALALATMFVVGGTSYVDARQFGYNIDAGTVDDVTTTVCTTGLNGNVRSFGNGVDMDQVWALEVEKGSPGSGAWSAVLGHSDIFPVAQGGAAVGGPVQVDNYTSPVPACFRLHMTTDAGGTAQVQVVTDGNDGTTTMTTASHSRSFDDFMHGTVPITTTHNGNSFSWVITDNSTSNSAVPTIVAGQEGILTWSSGDGGTTTDANGVSAGIAGYGSLVSSGLTIVEWRVSMSQIADAKANFGLGDVVTDATEQNVFKCNTNVCAEGLDTAQTDAVMFMFDTDSADAQTDMWNAISMNNSAMGNAADEYTTGHSPVASTYARLRIEVDALGHAYWYYNGSLVGAEPLAVATTAVIFPVGTANSPDDGTGTVNLFKIDYVDWYSPRPTT